VVNPTIATHPHTISVASIQKGGSVKMGRRVQIVPGDLVFSRLHTQSGSFAFADRSYLATTTFLPLAVDETRADRRFLFWALHVRVPTLSVSDTVGRETYKPQDILSLKIPLPPLWRQRRMVARLEELAAKLKEARVLHRQAADETERLLGATCDRLFDDLAQRWARQPLGDQVEIQGGFAFKSDEYLEQGLPIVRISNLENGIVHVKGSPCMPESCLEEFKRFVLQPGDILIAMSGATTGKVGVVPGNCRRWLLNQRVGRFLPKDRQALEQRYVYWLARSVQKQVFEAAYGAAQPNTSPGDLEKLQFPFPPLPEQRRIVAYLDDLQTKMDALKRLQAETAAELDALLPSILNQAFKGEL
jgi:type I restriction enzyme S subunit